ncbi:formate-dependent phosphoribosylglycinamide formyltransferase [Chitinivibrio alkaliphilus]|uniref:Formate-dependent phosphoribosylglycinamide formyltransferase n=1 Tax=Chitinivibrio alkaliphilus ACht1 TaxID=1313304 RepID=U7D940_9BACT|nr:formate-dependent phosphoribosylglycinamide formyltransferase [Chitinivibrio alkaliphilus]ERP32101.1 phosphoribosylglycinamide formyltransferase 2 [Chitinivibrio alkaliphilus ACht1]
MTTVGTPLSKTAKKVLLLGSGELGKEVAIELIRYGVEIIACDAYKNAPAMQVAQKSSVFSMLDGNALRAIVEKEQPDLIVPEVEAIATDTLLELESEGYTVIPTAKATRITMDRESIRTLAAETLNLPTSPYRFVASMEELKDALEEIGYPAVVKPIMSSSGKGQSILRSPDDLDAAWQYSQEGGRAGNGRIIVEGFVDFDYEITLLTVCHSAGVSFCPPIGHVQIDGDYAQSWQPHPMKEKVLARAQEVAKAVAESLGGYGLFGVELFVSGEEVIFSEVSPRPHDTGMVTLISQNLSEFALHARAILGLPIPEIIQYTPAASRALVVKGESTTAVFSGIDKALSEKGTDLRLFGKPSLTGKRRMGVLLSTGKTISEAQEKALRMEEAISIQL